MGENRRRGGSEHLHREGLEGEPGRRVVNPGELLLHCGHGLGAVRLAQRGRGLKNRCQSLREHLGRVNPLGAEYSLQDDRHDVVADTELLALGEGLAQVLDPSGLVAGRSVSLRQGCQ